MSKCVYHKGGSKKYVLDESFKEIIPFKSPKEIITSYAMLDVDGYIVIDSGYEWDGASGPTIDTDNTMDGSLVHDIIYQFLRERRFGSKNWIQRAILRHQADKCIYTMLVNNKMSRFRAWYWYLSLRVAGFPYIRSKI